MMRCCYENLFYIGGIAKEGDVFVEAMKHEDAASRSARGRLLFEHELIDANREDGQQLKDFLKTLSKTGRSLDPKSIATKGPIAQGYIIYSVVSEDAAHPTLMSLSRHVAAAEGGNMFSIVPTLVEEGEIEDTIIFTCAALLGACYATGEVLGRTLVAPEVKKRMDEMLVLQGLV